VQGDLVALFTTADLTIRSRASRRGLRGPFQWVVSADMRKPLDNQPGFILRQPKAAQSIVHHAERQLALTHQRQSDALALEVGQFGVPVRPRHRIDPRICPSSDLKDAPRLKRIRCSDHKEAGTFDVRRLKHSGRRGIAPDNRLTVRPEFLGATTVSFDHDMRHTLLPESLANRTTNAAMPDDDGVALPLRCLGADIAAGERLTRPLQPRQQPGPRSQPGR
jgi:hypothetical protein